MTGITTHVLDRHAGGPPSAPRLTGRQGAAPLLPPCPLCYARLGRQCP